MFCYLGEFCPKSTRGKVLSFVYIFWGFGGVYVASLGWLIVPQKGKIQNNSDVASFSSSSSGVPPNFIEDSGGDECLLVRKVGEYERQRVNLLTG